MNFDENNPFLKKSLMKTTEMQQSDEQFEDLLAQQEKKLEAEDSTNQFEDLLAAQEQRLGLVEAPSLLQDEQTISTDVMQKPEEDLKLQIPPTSDLEKAKESPLDYIRRKYNISTPDKSEELAKLQRKTDVLQSLSDIDRAAGQLGSWKTVLAKKMGYDVPEYKGGAFAKLAEREKQKFAEKQQLEEQQRKKELEGLSMGKTMMEFDEMLKNEEELNNPSGLLANTLKNAAKTLNVDLPEGITPKQILRVMPNLTTLAEQRKTKLAEAEAEKESKRQQYEKDIELEMLKQKGQKELKQMELEKKKTEPTEGQKATDKEFAKEYANWVSEKGSIGANKGIANVQEAIREMQANPDLTGGLGNIAYALAPESLKSALDEKIGKIETRLRSAVVDTLRPLLGAQFAATEGERIFKQTFDPNQPMSENISRARLVLQDLQNQVESRKNSVEYWEKYGTLEGYKAFSPEQIAAPAETPKPQQFKAGDIRVKNGKEYIRDADGKWRPVK